MRNIIIVICLIFIASCARKDIDYDRDRLIFRAPASQVKDSIKVFNGYANIIHHYRIDQKKELFINETTFGNINGQIDISQISILLGIGEKEAERMIGLIRYLYDNNIDDCFFIEGGSEPSCYSYKGFQSSSLFAHEGYMFRYISLVKNEHDDMQRLFKSKCAVHDIKDSLILYGIRKYAY